MNSHSNTKYRAYLDELRDDLKVTLQKGLEFINWGKYIDKNSRVFVKPNFTFPYYKEGVTYFKDVFMTLDKIKILFDEWRKEYNQVRPHSVLIYHPPAPEAVMPVILT